MTTETESGVGPLKGTPLFVVNADLNGLSESATKLIDVVSRGFGNIFGPYLNLNRARQELAKQKLLLEGSADLINLKLNLAQEAIKSGLFISEEQYIDTLNRAIAQCSTENERIASIVGKAVADLNDDAHPEDIDKDWIELFLDKSKKVGDAKLKNVWSKLLAEQSNTPSKFSKRTIRELFYLEKKEAVLFELLCRYVVFVDEAPIPIFFGNQAIIYGTKFEYEPTLDSYEHLMLLEHANLIKFNSEGNFGLTEFGDQLRLEYFGKSITVNSKVSGERFIQTGSVSLTKTGREILELCNPTPNYTFFENVKSMISSIEWIAEQNNR